MKQYYVEPVQYATAVNGVEVTYQETRRNSVATSAHIHSAVELIYVKEGSFEAYINEKRLFLSAGDLMLIRSNTIHRIFTKDEEKNGYYIIKINPSLIFDYSFGKNGEKYALEFVLTKGDSKLLFETHEIKNTGMLPFLETIVRESEEPRYGSDIAVKAAVANLLLGILRFCRSETMEKSGEASELFDESLGNVTIRHIYDAIVYINENYSEELTAKGCGERFNMSYSYFSRTFKQITGMSFKEYLNTVRINQAQKALITTEKSVTEISASCGFNNVSYFIMVYREMKGITPYAFRMSCKGDV